MKIEFNDAEVELITEALNKHYGGLVYISEMQPDKRAGIEKTLIQIKQIQNKFNPNKENDNY